MSWQQNFGGCSLVYSRRRDHESLLLNDLIHSREKCCKRDPKSSSLVRRRVMADRPLGRIAFLLFLFAAIETALGQGVLTYKKRDPSQIPVAVQLKRSVVQIELTCKQGQADSHFGGTGFLVSYPDPKLPPNSMFQYLVTNRHVAECWNEKHQPQTVTSLAIRANTSDGRAKLISKNPSDWRFLSDPSIDLAAMPILMPSEIQAVSFPINSFATRDYLSTNVIAEGSPIIVAGYFYQFPGKKKSEAIVRQGDSIHDAG